MIESNSASSFLASMRTLADSFWQTHSRKASGRASLVNIGNLHSKSVASRRRQWIRRGRFSDAWHRRCLATSRLYAPFFASSSSIQVCTKAEKLMPRRAVSSFATSRKVSGDTQSHGDLVAVHREAPDLGLVGVALDELLITAGICAPIARNAIHMHLRHCNTGGMGWYLVWQSRIWLHMSVGGAGKPKWS